MSDTRVDDAFAGKRSPELVQQAAIEKVQQDSLAFWRMAINPLSHVPQPVLQVWIKFCPILAAFV